MCVCISIGEEGCHYNRICSRVEYLFLLQLIKSCSLCRSNISIMFPILEIGKAFSNLNPQCAYLYIDV